MCGLGGKRGSIDRASAIARQRDTSPITIMVAELATTIVVRDPTAARFPVWSEPGTSADGPRGYLWPSQGLQICEVSFVTTRTPPRT